MKQTKIERTARFFADLSKLGFSYSEATALRRIELTLHRWAEQCCGNSDNYKSWSIERDEETNKPFLCVYPHQGKSYRKPIADRESGAFKRLSKIMESHPELWSYHQGDCRGCMLYVGRKADVNGYDLDSVYTRGFAVCI